MPRAAFVTSYDRMRSAKSRPPNQCHALWGAKHVMMSRVQRPTSVAKQLLQLDQAREESQLR